MLRKTRSDRRVWLDTMITLLVLELMAFFYSGLRAAAVGMTCVCVSLLTEIISLRLMGKRFTADDLSCTSDGLILALMLPAAIDYRIAVLASVFAGVCAKNIFGGRRNMIFSPAAAAYVFIFTSWKSQLLLYTEPHVRLGITEKAAGLVSSSSSVFNTTGKMDFTAFELLMGNFTGAPGAVSILLLFIAAGMLIMRRNISAGAFVGTMAGTVIMAAIVPMSGAVWQSVKYTLCTNMILFAAVYIISDRRIAPRRNYYAFFYGFFIAVFSYILVLTTAKENAIVLVSVLMTPAALAFRNLEKRIEESAAEAAEDEKRRMADVPEEAQDKALEEIVNELEGGEEGKNE